MAKDILILVLAGDLLILFYTGYWFDPNPVIEHLELAFLWFIAVWTTVSIFKNYIKAVGRSK